MTVGAIGGVLGAIGGTLGGVLAPPAGGEALLRVPAGAASANLTGFVVRVDLSDMPETWWAQEVSAGGIRVTGSGGSSLPTDVAWIDTSRRKGDLYFKADLLALSDNDFTVSFDPELSAPPVTDAIGRNAVWSGYEAVFLRDTVDRTGKHVANVTGSPESDYRFSNLSGLLSNAHQGVAVDDDHFYIIDTVRITKYSRADWSVVATTVTPIADANLGSAYNHLGDGFEHGGLLYLPLSEYPRSATVREQIAVYDTSDLSFVAAYDVSATGHQLASICTDGTHIFSVGYNSGPDYSTTIQKWTFAGAHVETITLPSALTGMQGVTIHEGSFWLGAGADNDGIWEFDGAALTKRFDMAAFGEEQEGLAEHGGRLFSLNMPDTPNDKSVLWEILLEPSLHFEHDSYLMVADVPTFTEWTIGASVTRVGPVTGNEAIAGYDRAGSTNNNNRASLVMDNNASGTTHYWGIWNSTDGWLHRTVAVGEGEPSRRLHMVQSGTAYRALFVDANKFVDNGASQRPVSGTVFTVGTGSVYSPATEARGGAIGRAYLRGDILSDAWIAAEQVSWETPQQFYAIMPQ